MTWEFQTTIADDIHRIVDTDGRGAWGVVHNDFDVDDPRVLALAEVALPNGVRSLLVVPASPGGLVLDVVRAYQGLTEAELCTLFLGIIEALQTCTRPEDRLTLSAFALDADGRPVTIPGVSASMATTPRRAVGEMIYHAVYGRPWAEVLLPVDLALTESSAALRSLVNDLLDDTASDIGLNSVLAEAADSLRTLDRPAALPLVPAESATAPEAALTARLRVASGLRPSRETTEAVGSTPGSPAPSLHSGGVSPLRAGARNSRRYRRGRRQPDGRRRLLNTGNSLWTRLRGSELRRMFGRSTLLIGVAVSLTLLGGIIVWASLSNYAGVRGEGASAAQDADSSPEPTQDLSVEEVTGILEELCRSRAKALGDGDAAALQALTVPESAAAAADELTDPAAFADSDYSIGVEDVEIVAIDDDGVVASALMHSSAGSGGALQEFAAHTVEFELQRVEGRWLVAEVREVASP
ncbi:hypothetical protein SAMN04489752_2337 [Brevibacterium siliguriense]|uniref:Uncharacterized protein n=1 Tax=Brevibacterium siliguriense TaxID=1136497 RepID=A0A1H1UGJ1_9MICO|nr:hypothetical protein [Brevibacterium siliguriense]SDS71617.1 hypothetical protein SAMN04489752_2337 [Brevibacterium siliguriense]